MGAAMTSRLTVTLRQPSRDKAELVIAANGDAVVHPLTLDQIKSLAVQIVRALAAWPEARA
jgi:hypothetical protein